MVVTVIMPVVLLVLFSAIFTGITIFDGLRVKHSAYYTASIIAYTVMITGFSSVLISVTSDREAGRLKRFRGTPMPSWVYLVATIGRTVVIVGAVAIVLLLVGILGYGLKFSIDALIGLVVYVVVGTACFCALGLAFTRVCSTTESASAIGPFATLMIAFMSGTFITVDATPKWLFDIGKIFPLEHLTKGLQTAFLVPGSTGITANDIGVLVIWGAAGLLFAIRHFRWEPVAVGV
jgi:ABC-2 type transport system permease protein